MLLNDIIEFLIWAALLQLVGAPVTAAAAAVSRYRERRVLDLQATAEYELHCKRNGYLI